VAFSSTSGKDLEDSSSIESNSVASIRISLTTNASETSNNGDSLPKNFLQLKGISIANCNMGCNFNIASALWIMIQYELSILAIQEHTPWNKDLTPMKISSFEWTCNKWGFFKTISKLQIIIIDKQLATCQRDINKYEEGRVINTRLEISQ
jgi:hypothetical protein